MLVDNLNIHTPAALYEVFQPQEARRIVQKARSLYPQTTLIALYPVLFCRSTGFIAFIFDRTLVPPKSERMKEPPNMPVRQNLRRD